MNIRGIEHLMTYDNYNQGDLYAQVINILKKSASQNSQVLRPPQVGNQSQWSQDHRIYGPDCECEHDKAYRVCSGGGPKPGDGDCSTKYQGKFWCYLHGLSGCSDAMPSRQKPGTYWSWRACPEIPTPGTLTRNPELAPDNFLLPGQVCSGADGRVLTHSTGTVGTSNLNQGPKECKCSSFSRGLNGNCQSKYKGYYWCYLEPNKHEGCADFHFLPSKRGGGRYWSWSACYNDD